MCRKQELRVLLVITTTGSEAGHVLHQAFKKIRISLLLFCKCFEAEVSWQSLNRNCECHSLATAEFPFWPVTKFDIQTKRNIPSVTPLHIKQKQKRTSRLQIQNNMHVSQVSLHHFSQEFHITSYQCALIPNKRKNM